MCTAQLYGGARLLGITSFALLSKCVTAFDSAKLYGVGCLLQCDRRTTYPDASKGLSTLSGYLRTRPGCYLSQRFVALGAFCLREFANSARNLASAFSRLASHALRVAMTPR